MTTTRSLRPATLVSRREVARETYVLRYEFTVPSALVPGQFAMVHPGSDDEYILPRPLSILDAEDDHLDLLVKIAGRGTRALVEASPGDRHRMFAPLGSGFDLPALAGQPLILVAGGVGIVPLHLTARRLVDMGRPPVRALFGARAPEDLPLPLFEDPQAGQWELFVESGATGSWRDGLVTRGLEEALREFPDATILTCGPTPMMRAVARIGRDGGRPVWLCLEEQMGCGAGVCRACVVERKIPGPSARWTVCREGPVLELDAIRYLPEDFHDCDEEGTVATCDR